jgi:stearoyl-CoA desaturase (delta-9 desaturase)
MLATATMTFTEAEMTKPPHPRGEIPPLFDEPVNIHNWFMFVNWTNTILLLVALYGIATTKLQKYTLILSIVWYFATAMGITAGYHRLWSHRAYDAKPLLKVVFALVGAGAVQGSIRWWCHGHRAHHRYTDTDKDPYSAHRGLLYSHIGWMLNRRPHNRIGYADVADLEVDPIVKWQHKYYPQIAVIMAFGFPTLVAGFGWCDWRGGFYFAGVARLVSVYHATFCVNNLAHWLGETSFDDHHSSSDQFLAALVTISKSYRNFQDCCNAAKYQNGPTKWLIKFFSFFGLAYNLKTFSQNEVPKGQIFMTQKEIQKVKEGINWGIPISNPPMYSWDEFFHQSKTQGKPWTLIEGIIYDVSTFIDEHPGGARFIKLAIGKDITTAFNGGVHNHSNSARSLLTAMRVGIVRGGVQDKSLKEKPTEQTINPRKTE